VKFLKKIVPFIVFHSGFVYADTLPDIFYRSPPVKLPISAGKSPRDEALINSSKYIESYESPQNETYFDSMLKLEEAILSDKTTGPFSLASDQWSQNKKTAQKAKDWSISRLPCMAGIDCFLLNDRGGVKLIVAKNKEITDWQLVTARQYKVDEKTGSFSAPIATMDTTFGDGVVWAQLPITNFEKTGIFCSEIVTGLGGGDAAQYKRRITPDGRIENKKIEGGYKECKEPW